MEAHDLPQALRMILEQRGWTVTQLADRLGMSRPWAYAVMSGERSPSMARASRLLARVGWEIRISPKSDSGDDVKRREFMTAAASVAFVPSATTTTPYHDPAYVRLLAQRAARIRYETGGASAARLVIRQAKAIETASVSANPELRSAVSLFMRNASYVLRNAGHNDNAERLASSALMHAHRGGDHSQGAAARSALSLIAWSKGNNDLAAIHAQRGLQTPEISPEDRAYLGKALGLALSRIRGQERKAREAVDSALAVEEISTIARADVMGFAGSALHNIGADRHAFAALNGAIELCVDRSVFLQTAYTMDKATVALDTEDLSQAAYLMRELSYLVPMTDSRRLDGEINRVLAGTAKWATVPEIRQAREQLGSVGR